MIEFSAPGALVGRGATDPSAIAAVRTTPSSSRGDLRSDADNRDDLLAAPAELGETTDACGAGGGIRYLPDQLVGRKHGCSRPGEEIGDRDRPFATRRGGDNRGIGCEQGRGRIRSRRCIAEVASDGGPALDGPGADLCRRRCESRTELCTAADRAIVSIVAPAPIASVSRETEMAFGVTIEMSISRRVPTRPARICTTTSVPPGDRQQLRVVSEKDERLVEEAGGQNRLDRKIQCSCLS